jgi:hypothetical protein
MARQSWQVMLNPNNTSSAVRAALMRSVSLAKDAE